MPVFLSIRDIFLCVLISLLISLCVPSLGIYPAMDGLISCVRSFFMYVSHCFFMLFLLSLIYYVSVMSLLSSLFLSLVLSFFLSVFRSFFMYVVRYLFLVPFIRS